MARKDKSGPSAILSILLHETQGDDRRSVDLRWADHMLRTPRRGLIATWALQGVSHRYPVGHLEKPLPFGVMT
jgi:hypothetical protein